MFIFQDGNWGLKEIRGIFFPRQARTKMSFSCLEVENLFFKKMNEMTLLTFKKGILKQREGLSERDKT